ncbi:isocitrate lyase/phosphoenolpyruvate mutase family protein [Frankia sp. AgB32]|uniref:isocitrate lyase/phosphoenolpyruvate mutase family protein n=1 Tax=Frankia sp. AgB32 TaxID=631119 RepID=UPI00200BF716|nr:isocitrate lyase/phosphoenolpyruvate mutase family protein [Frankia sp. AgB32]MCK9896089.1 isocitrate lyase/phosphoenolpyruvate mutase family protein [Frankia sp. AgB32]
MRRITNRTFRDVLVEGPAVRAAGVHDALGAMLAEQAGFAAVWASSLGISAARCVPDASLLTMTEYLQAAVHMQRRVGIPVVADCDTGFGDTLNIAYLVHEYEAAGISAVCIEDKQYPKMNSFVPGQHALLDTAAFARKISIAKAVQTGADFFVIARTEALISGLGVDEALHRCHAYAEAGADAVLVHSRQRTSVEVEAFLDRWDARAPVVVVPTTYPDWHFDDAVKAGVSMVIYANQGLRATIDALRTTFGSIIAHGGSAHLEADLASLTEVFELQRLRQWRELEG